MVYLTRQARFSAGHRYFHPEWTEEENLRRFGSCARPHGHGHDYLVEATVRGPLDAPVGMVINITELKAALQSALEPLDGHFLDRRHPLMNDRNPTTETLARYVWSALEGRWETCFPHNVRIYENPTLWSDYRGEESVVYLTRRYEFSAAHRLHSPVLSDEENREVFGKCNHPNGHGHNYGLEVTVSGEADPDTGMVMDLTRLDEVVHRQVVDRMDHRHLNYDLPEFEALNPTSENLAVVAWSLLKPELGDSLVKVGIRETDRNYFEFGGEE
ncbi:MAG: 6-carboxytetrahydropterin synthase [Armatimonadetes bacterium]|nr:6-carboxytetrahydropterin synthase [Armatimonadota bacterium]